MSEVPVTKDTILVLDFPWQRHGLSGELFIELINEINFPLQTLHLPCSQSEGKDRNYAKYDHCWAKQGVLLGLVRG